MKKGSKNPNAGRKLFDGKNYELVLQKLREAWALGCPDTEASALAGISNSALHAFLGRHTEITAIKEQLLEEPFLAARKTIKKCIADGDGALALKYMERKKRREFGESVNVTTDSLEDLVTGSDKPKKDA